jgi:hypothetical protein
MIDTTAVALLYQHINTPVAYGESRQSSAMYADLNTAVLEGVHCMEALVQARAAFAAATTTAASFGSATAAAGADVVPLSVLTSALTSAACSVRSRRLDECCPRLCEELAAQCSIDSDGSDSSNGMIITRTSEVTVVCTVRDMQLAKAVLLSPLYGATLSSILCDAVA